MNMNDDNQFCDEHVYYKGNLDFTIKGARLYAELQDKFMQEAGISASRFDGIVGYKWKKENIVSIFAKERRDIDEEISMITDDPSCLFDDNQRLIKIGEPYPIQNWWITRFDQLDNGWRVDIQYKENM